MSFLNQETTDHDLAAWMDDLLTRIELRVLMEHEVINHQGDDAGCGDVDGAPAALGRTSGWSSRHTPLAGFLNGT
jgi:hypothetical protein